MSLRIGGLIPLNKARKQVVVYIYSAEDVVQVSRTRVKQGLGLHRDQLLKANLAFAKELLKLTHIVSSQQVRAREKIKSIGDEIEREQILQDSLTLDEEICLETLDKLREIGAYVRSDLSRGMVEALQINGFLKEQEQEEPSLTFIQDTDEGNAQTPILWDMMHENDRDKFDDDLDEHNWGRFWGFRVPITHWVFKDSSNEIRLRKTFSAIHEGLHFAAKEAKLLIRHSGNKERHRSLAEVFRDKVNQDLQYQIEEDCQTSPWLKNYLEDLTAKKNRRFVNRWIEDTLISIFKDYQNNYDLLHFACHCVANNEREFLSALVMKVAGEPICLKVGTIATKLRDKEDESQNSGRLVFLNACDSGGQGDSHEPPGFPNKWIECHKASAVIVTLCEIPDYFAYAFAEKFYENLFKGINDQENFHRLSYISEALLETRRYFMKKHNNPLGLAYMLYAIDGAYVSSDYL